MVHEKYNEIKKYHLALMENLSLISLKHILFFSVFILIESQVLQMIKVSYVWVIIKWD